MFVGETGVGRIVQRACDLMNEYKTENSGPKSDVRKYGGIDLQTIQKYLNFHFSISVDLFGQELSTNAATYFNTGIKGRFGESKIDDDHLLHDSSYSVLELQGQRIINCDAPALNAVNERLRDDYIEDCNLGVRRWNKIIADSGHNFSLKLPHRAFHRGIGQFSEIQTDPEGNIISQTEWDRRHSDWLPTHEDQQYIQSLMHPVTEPGKIAGWIAPPKSKINRHPFKFEFVRFN